MNLLLDTHVFIWWTSAPEKLPEKVFSACADGENSLILSVVSAWEIQIKNQMGKLRLGTPLDELIQKEREKNNMQILPVSLAHVLALNNLPPIHSDPFDRMLIAQAASEEFTLVTKDGKFASYPVSILW